MFLNNIKQLLTYFIHFSIDYTEPICNNHAINNINFSISASSVELVKPIRLSTILHFLAPSLGAILTNHHFEHYRPHILKTV